MIAEILLSTAIALLSYAFYKWATLNNDFFEKRNIKYMKPTFLLGNSGSIFLKKMTAAELGQTIYTTFPNEPLAGFFDFRQPNFIARDPKVIKQICVKDFDHFVDHQGFVDGTVDSLFGNGLISMKGDKWRHMRATLSPAFTGSKMRQMFELVSQCADDIVKHFLNESADGQVIEVEMKDLFSRYANDVIASCAFGIKINSIADPTNDFYLSGKTLTNFGGALSILKIVLIKHTIPMLARALKIRLLDKKVSNNFRSIILDTMELRKKQKIFRPDMINILLQVREGNLSNSPSEPKENAEGFADVDESEVGKSTTTQKWTDDELAAQCFLFFFAGFETSSTLLTFAAYELVANPDIQQKLYEEIAETNEMVGGKQITFDVLQRMKYMDQVVCETLRKWPPFVNMDRRCTKDYKYSDDDGLQFEIEKGQAILIPTYGVQHDEKYFPEPDKFDPERFNDDNKDNIVPGTYLPFGIGPRNCIGSRFALTELKAILYNLLLNFSFERCQKTQIPLRLKRASFILSVEDGMHLELKRRGAAK